jgi:hypothetical protein
MHLGVHNQHRDVSFLYFPSGNLYHYCHGVHQLVYEHCTFSLLSLLHTTPPVSLKIKRSRATMWGLQSLGGGPMWRPEPESRTRSQNARQEWRVLKCEVIQASGKFLAQTDMWKRDRRDSYGTPFPEKRKKLGRVCSGQLRSFQVCNPSVMEESAH